MQIISTGSGPFKGDKTFTMVLPAGTWNIIGGIQVNSTARSSGRISIQEHLHRTQGARRFQWYTRKRGIQHFTPGFVLHLDKDTIIDIRFETTGGSPELETYISCTFLAETKQKCNCDMQLLIAQGCKCGGT